MNGFFSLTDNTMPLTKCLKDKIFNITIQVYIRDKTKFILITLSPDEYVKGCNNVKSTHDYNVKATKHAAKLAGSKSPAQARVAYRSD